MKNEEKKTTEVTKVSLPATVEDFDLATFDPVDTEVNTHPDHNWDEDPVAFGRVLKIEETVQERQGVPTDVLILVIENANGITNVWETAALEKFFKTVDIGDDVVIRYTHMTPIKKGKKIREFDVHVRKNTQA